MRRIVVLGNWKMNFTVREAADISSQFRKLLESKNKVDVGIAPAYLSVSTLAESFEDSVIMIGAQDVFWAEKGAFTGNVSAGMLADAKVQFCLIGHSEKRGKFGKLEVPESTIGYFGETDETVNLKLKSLLFHGLIPVLCCGETLGEREAGNTDEIVSDQIKKGLDGIDGAELFQLIIAYEPVWAIGTGRTCDAAEADRVCSVIRSTLATLYGTDLAEATRILYGGSVKPSNSAELFAMPNIDGGLVGGASMDPVELNMIVTAAEGV